MSEGANNTGGILRETGVQDYWPPGYREMHAHFSGLPPDTAIREVFHGHSEKDLGQFIKGKDFSARAKKLLGYRNPSTYSERSGSPGYATRWLPIEDDHAAILAFSKIFYRFNVLLSLGRYPLAYAVPRLKVILAEDELRMATFRKDDPKVAERIPALEERIKAAEAAVPNDCYVDLAFDIDVGDGKEIATIGDAIPVFLRLVDLCERYGMPHTAFFSGRRGFHLVIPSTAMEQTLASDNHLINRRITELIQEETGALHLDNGIYVSRHMLRLPNSRHYATGRFKVALTRDDIERGEACIFEKAQQPIAVPGVSTACNEHLAGLYSLAAEDVRNRSRHTVSPNKTRKLSAARQLAPREIQSSGAGPTTDAGTPIGDMVHPPCVSEALTTGVVDTRKANRNQITVFLAIYFKATGRGHDETAELLVRHASEVLARFSASSSADIERTTRSATASVFRRDSYRFNCGNARKLGFTCSDTCELFPRTETAMSRRLHRVDPASPCTPPSPLLSAGERIEFDDVEALRTHMAERIETYIADAKAGKYPEGHILPLLMRAPGGSGKTITTFETLARRGLRTLWVATRYDLFDNIPDHLKPRWLCIEGRHGGRTLPSGGTLPATCAQHDAAGVLRENRLNVNHHLCSQCEGQSGCIYNAQFDDVDRNWFVQQPMYLHKVKACAAAFDVVVFDEDILSKFVETVEIRSKDVQRVLQLVAPEAPPSFLVRGDEARDLRAARVRDLRPLECFLASLEHLLREDHVDAPITGDELHHRMEEAYACVAAQGFTDTDPPTLRDAVRAIPASMDTLVNKIYRARDPGDVPLQFLDALLPVLRFELFDRMPGSDLSRLRFKSQRAPAGGTDPQGTARSRNVLEVTTQAPSPRLPKPTIILDATGKPEIYERLFGIRPIVYAPTMRIKNPVTQVYSTSGSYASFCNAGHSAHLFEALQTVLAKEPHSLVICKQEFEPKVQALLPPTAAVTHFYGNRGSNAFQDFRRVVIFGMPGLPPEAITRYASAFFYADGLSTGTEMQVRRYEGHDVGVKVLVYKDPLIQALAETGREDEVLQSIHRVRPGLDATKDIVLITNIVIPELPVTTLVPLRDLRDRKPQTRVDAKYDLLVRLAKRQFETLGFVSPARTLWPVVGPLSPTDTAIDAAVRAPLEARGAWEDVPEASRLSRTRLHAYGKEVCEAAGLKPFDVRCVTTRGSSPLEIWGRDSTCIDAAREFFKNHPRHSSERIRVETG